ncbi:MAG: Rpn family recombination-promoting nuclease/putative transposase [Sporomusaceae bacterium]|nr:Rpn family recombination-promoting nuclease/putative transposase [Sporomusaceae bacterium]
MIEKKQPTEYQKHDPLFKNILSNQEMFLQLLAFIKEKWVDTIDAGSLQKVNNSFVMPDFSKRESDIIYRAKTKDGENDIYLYVLTELQSSVNYFMPYRLLIYMICIWQEHLKQFDEKEIRRKTFRLPPIIPIILSNSPQRWTAALNFREILAGEELFGNHIPNFQYFIIDINRCDKKALAEMGTMLSKIFILEQSKETYGQLIQTIDEILPDLPQLPQKHLKVFLDWFQESIIKKLAPDQQKQLLPNIENVLSGKMEVLSMVSNAGRLIEKSLKTSRMEGLRQGKLEGLRQGQLEGIRQGQLEGLRQGKLEGIRQGKLEAAENLLNEGLDEKLIAKALGLSLEEVNGLKIKK